MNICVFDTETTSLEKPFCYNIGYIIYNTDDSINEIEKNFVIEQVWHNPMLFTTAYYANKRDIYVSEMRARKTEMTKFGYVCQEMIRDFKKYDVKMAFAFNSSFDEKVFDFNCDWFKCNNPFDDIEIKDIRGFAHHFLVNKDYKAFCDKYSLYSESGNYSTTAETCFRYITRNMEFIEEHTALSDSIIELEILKECYNNGADYESNYEAFKSIERKILKHWELKDGDETIFDFDCHSLTVYKSKNIIKIK